MVMPDNKNSPTYFFSDASVTEMALLALEKTIGAGSAGSKPKREAVSISPFRPVVN